MPQLSLPWLKALSGLSINLSAAWFALAMVTPNFANLSTPDALIVLIRDIASGIVFLIINVIIERRLTPWTTF